MSILTVDPSHSFIAYSREILGRILVYHLASIKVPANLGQNLAQRLRISINSGSEFPYDLRTFSRLLFLVSFWATNTYMVAGGALTF